MCFISRWFQPQKELEIAQSKILELKVALRQSQSKITELEQTLAEYHEIIETGWDYPDVTLRLPKSRDIIPKAAIKREAQGDGKYRLVISQLPDFWIADIADTLSEDPFFGYGHNLILANLPQPYAPYRYEDLAVGDSVVYEWGGKLISHQIVKIEIDEQGRKYTLRGRNTGIEDPYEIRDSMIKYLIVAVIF